MENKEVSKRIKKAAPPIDLDDIDLDDITFKPITQGLGFHPEKKEIPIIKSKISSPKPNFTARNTYVSPPTFSSSMITPKPVKIRPKIEEEILEDTQVSERLMAFSLDFLIISLATSITILILGLSSGLSIEILRSIFTPKEIILFTTGVFSIYFLFYFSVLDLSSTVGKSMMGLEIRTLEGKRPGIQNTFSRSLVTLLSIPLLGIPIVTVIEEKISGIKVYKRKCSI
ncbi:MAG: RDD family protein [Bacteriovoracales bacterium]